MITKISQKVSSLFPLPLAADPDDADFPRFVDEGTRSESVARIHGSCAPFCATDHYVPTSGASVEEHGVKCLSDAAVSVSPTAASGRSVALIGFLARPYLHGIYPGFEAHSVERQGFVELVADIPTADGWTEVEMYLTAAEARTLAAGLTRLADGLEAPAKPLCTARAEREALAREEGRA